MESKDQPSPPYYDPKRADIATVQEHGQNNPEKSLPLQLTINLSLGVLIILLFVTAYYYRLLG
jgi:hypothetical protein